MTAMNNTNALRIDREPLSSPAQPSKTSTRAPLRLVAGWQNRARPSRRKLTIALATLGVVFVVQLALAMVVIQDAYHADELATQQLELQREHTAALETADAAASPQQLAQRASELGMVPAAGQAYLDLQSGTIAGDSTSAGALAKPVDPKLVPNSAADLEPNKPEAEPGEKNDGSGASEAKPKKPAVPSEFEIQAPDTH